MARFRLTEAHFLGDKYVEGGAIVDWDGPPSRHMTPVDEEGKSIKAAYDIDRPHMRRSRDLLPQAAVVQDPMARRPGTPRVAGPPGQEPMPSADPANPIRTAEIVEAQKVDDVAKAEVADARAEQRNADREAQAEEDRKAGEERRKRTEEINKQRTANLEKARAAKTEKGKPADVESARTEPATSLAQSAAPRHKK